MASFSSSSPRLLWLRVFPQLKTAKTLHSSVPLIVDKPVEEQKHPGRSNASRASFRGAAVFTHTTHGVRCGHVLSSGGLPSVSSPSQCLTFRGSSLVPTTGATSAILSAKHDSGGIRECAGNVLLHAIPSPLRPRHDGGAMSWPPSVQKRTMSKKSRTKKAKPKSDVNAFKAGEEYKVFTHETPTIFRLLSGTGVTQLAVWTGYKPRLILCSCLCFISFGLSCVALNSLLGMSFLPTIPTWMIFLGTPMSIGLFMMVRWHANHHVAGIAVIPGLADQIVLTTHTMTGGLQSRTLLRYQVDMSDSAARPGKYRQIYVRGETWNYVMDTDGSILDQRLFDLLMDNQPIPKQ